MPTSCECMLVITVIISTRNGDGSEKLVSKQPCLNVGLAKIELAKTKERVQSAIKECFGRGCQVDDIITIGDIIVNANDIIAVGFRIVPLQITGGAPESKSDSEDPETK